MPPAPRKRALNQQSTTPAPPAAAATKSTTSQPTATTSLPEKRQRTNTHDTPSKPSLAKGTKKVLCAQDSVLLGSAENSLDNGDGVRVKTEVNQTDDAAAAPSNPPLPTHSTTSLHNRPLAPNVVANTIPQQSPFPLNAQPNQFTQLSQALHAISPTPQFTHQQHHATTSIFKPYDITPELLVGKYGVLDIQNFPFFLNHNRYICKPCRKLYRSVVAQTRNKANPVATITTPPVVRDVIRGTKAAGNASGGLSTAITPLSPTTKTPLISVLGTQSKTNGKVNDGMATDLTSPLLPNPLHESDYVFQGLLDAELHHVMHHGELSFGDTFSCDLHQHKHCEYNNWLVHELIHHRMYYCPFQPCCGHPESSNNAPTGTHDNDDSGKKGRTRVGSASTHKATLQYDQAGHDTTTIIDQTHPNHHISSITPQRQPLSLLMLKQHLKVHNVVLVDRSSSIINVPITTSSAFSPVITPIMHIEAIPPLPPLVSPRSTISLISQGMALNAIGQITRNLDQQQQQQQPGPLIANPLPSGLSNQDRQTNPAIQHHLLDTNLDPLTTPLHFDATLGDVVLDAQYSGPNAMGDDDGAFPNDPAPTHKNPPTHPFFQSTPFFSHLTGETQSMIPQQQLISHDPTFSPPITPFSFITMTANNNNPGFSLPSSFGNQETDVLGLTSFIPNYLHYANYPTLFATRYLWLNQALRHCFVVAEQFNSKSFAENETQLCFPYLVSSRPNSTLIDTSDGLFDTSDGTAFSQGSTKGKKVTPARGKKKESRVAETLDENQTATNNIIGPNPNDPHNTRFQSYPDHIIRAFEVRKQIAEMIALKSSIGVVPGKEFNPIQPHPIFSIATPNDDAMDDDESKNLPLGKNQPGEASFSKKAAEKGEPGANPKYMTQTFTSSSSAPLPIITPNPPPPRISRKKNPTINPALPNTTSPAASPRNPGVSKSINNIDHQDELELKNGPLNDAQQHSKKTSPAQVASTQNPQPRLQNDEYCDDIDPFSVLPRITVLPSNQNPNQALPGQSPSGGYSGHAHNHADESPMMNISDATRSGNVSNDDDDDDDCVFVRGTRLATRSGSPHLSMNDKQSNHHHQQQPYGGVAQYSAGGVLTGLGAVGQQLESLPLGNGTIVSISTSIAPPHNLLVAMNDEQTTAHQQLDPITSSQTVVGLKQPPERRTKRNPRAEAQTKMPSRGPALKTGTTTTTRKTKAGDVGLDLVGQALPLTTATLQQPQHPNQIAVDFRNGMNLASVAAEDNVRVLDQRRYGSQQLNPYNASASGTLTKSPTRKPSSKDNNKVRITNPALAHAIAETMILDNRQGAALVAAITNSLAVEQQHNQLNANGYVQYNNGYGLQQPNVLLTGNFPPAQQQGNTIYMNPNPQSMFPGTSPGGINMFPNAPMPGGYGLMDETSASTAPNSGNGYNFHQQHSISREYTHQRSQAVFDMQMAIIHLQREMQEKAMEEHAVILKLQVEVFRLQKAYQNKQQNYVQRLNQLHSQLENVQKMYPPPQYGIGYVNSGPGSSSNTTANNNPGLPNILPQSTLQSNQSFGQQQTHPHIMTGAHGTDGFLIPAPPSSHNSQHSHSQQQQPKALYNQLIPLPLPIHTSQSLLQYQNQPSNYTGGLTQGVSAQRQAPEATVIHPHTSDHFQSTNTAMIEGPQTLSSRRPSVQAGGFVGNSVVQTVRGGMSNSNAVIQANAHSNIPHSAADLSSSIGAAISNSHPVAVGRDSKTATLQYNAMLQANIELVDKNNHENPTSNNPQQQHPNQPLDNKTKDQTRGFVADASGFSKNHIGLLSATHEAIHSDSD